jgi:hypothetical protein
MIPWAFRGSQEYMAAERIARISRTYANAAEVVK